MLPFRQGRNGARFEPWLCWRRLGSQPDPGTICCVRWGCRVHLSCHTRCCTVWLAAFMAVGERPGFGKGYSCLRAAGLGLVSVRYLLHSQGCFPPALAKLHYPLVVYSLDCSVRPEAETCELSLLWFISSLARIEYRSLWITMVSYTLFKA